MTLLSFSEYLPLSDLLRILLVVLAWSPSSHRPRSSLAIVGLDRRERGETGSGTPMLAIGAGGLLVLVAIGLYALVSK